MKLRQTSRGFLLDVKATPKAAQEGLSGIHNGTLLVKTTAPPDKGKANAAITALLARTIGIPKSALHLVSGETGRNKAFHLVSHVEEVQTWLTRFEQQE